MKLQDITQEKIELSEARLDEIGKPAGILKRAGAKVMSKTPFLKSKGIGKMALQAEVNRLFSEYEEELGFQGEKPSRENLINFFTKQGYAKTATPMVDKIAPVPKPEVQGQDQQDSKDTINGKPAASYAGFTPPMGESHSLMDMWHTLNEDDQPTPIPSSKIKQLFIDVVRAVAKDNKQGMQQKLAQTGSLDKAKAMASSQSDADDDDDQDYFGWDPSDIKYELQRLTKAGVIDNEISTKIWQALTKELGSD